MQQCSVERDEGWRGRRERLKETRSAGRLVETAPRHESRGSRVACDVDASALTSSSRGQFRGFGCKTYLDREISLLE